MGKKRGEATRRILERLEKGPAFPKQLSDELRIGQSTVKYNLGKVLPELGVIKQLPDGKYAVKWWNPERNKVESSYKELESKLSRPPTPEEIASLTIEKPSVARDLLFKYIPNYSEPSEHEIEVYSKRTWIGLMVGALDLPKKDDLLKDRIEELVVKGIDEPTFKILFEGKDTISAVNEERLSILELFLNAHPDMVPTLLKSKVGNTLYLEIDWPDFARSIFRKIPEFHEIFRIKL